jgi:repressor LexA
VSPSQRRVFDWVAQYLADHGYAPTIREVQIGLGYGSPATVFKHLTHLREQGMLTGSGRRLRLGFRATGQGVGVARGGLPRSASTSDLL